MFSTLRCTCVSEENIRLIVDKILESPSKNLRNEPNLKKTISQDSDSSCSVGTGLFVGDFIPQRYNYFSDIDSHCSFDDIISDTDSTISYDTFDPIRLVVHNTLTELIDRIDT